MRDPDKRRQYQRTRYHEKLKHDPEWVSKQKAYYKEWRKSPEHRAKQRAWKKARYDKKKNDPYFLNLNRQRLKRHYYAHREELAAKRHTSVEQAKIAKRRDRTYFIKSNKNGNQYWYRGYQRLHRLIYQRYVGPIPKGWDVHHIDGNSLRNCLSNLEAMPHGRHTSLHKRGLI